MKRYRTYMSQSRHSRLSKRLLTIGIVLLVLLVSGSYLVHRTYNAQLRAVSSSHTILYITVATGTPPGDIAQLLHDKGLIRSTDAFQWYITSHNERDKLQAGTYRLSPSMTTPEIAEKIAHGQVATDLVTILPGQTITEIRKTFIESGFKVTDVDVALEADNYTGFAALADNPGTATLEGFLYPDSYQKNATTNPKEVIQASLNEMQSHLSTDVRNGFASQGLTVYQGVTLASIVEREVAKQSDRNQVAQVFLSRLRQNMRLGSDVTAIYAKSINDSAYDTTSGQGLPPGPIAAVSDSSLKSVAHPATSDWLYFVTGDDGTTYFSHTFEEHQDNVDKYCHKLCGQ